jgi:2-polyprenyl-3-methyl-5-hydroxy-6-metoxy-1,4-benzoquinol methylase
MSFVLIKNYWDNQPCNIKHSNKPFSTLEYFEDVQTKKYYVEPHIPIFAEFDKWKDKEVLELGCGIGTDSINFAKYGAKLTVVDISNISLDICKKRFELYGLHATFINANIEEIDKIIANKKFDLIYSFGVIHHTINPKKVINCVYNLLAKNGEFRFMVYSKVSYKLFWLMMENKIKDINEGLKVVCNQSEAQKDCPMTHVYTFDDIKYNLLDDRFNITDIYKDHIFTYNIDHYRNNIYIKDEYWENMSDKDIDKLAKEMGWHTMVKCKLNKKMSKDDKKGKYKYDFSIFNNLCKGRKNEIDKDKL